jgi:hypothetical protein
VVERDDADAAEPLRLLSVSFLVVSVDVLWLEDA